MHRRPSILSYRPKTSSAADDDSSTAAAPREHAMKRTASQTFSTTHYCDVKDSGMALDSMAFGAVSTHSHASSMSRAFGAVTGPFTRQKTRRRMSSISSATSAARRGSIQNLVEGLPSAISTRKPSTELLRMPLPHQDSGIPSLNDSQPHHPKQPLFRRFGSMRRRPTAAGPSGDVPQTQFFTPAATYPSQQIPGAAARQAAAAANQDRLNQLRREEHDTHRFLNGLIPTALPRDDDIKDDESGVDMTCASDIVRADSDTEKKMCRSSSSILWQRTILTCPQVIHSNACLQSLLPLSSPTSTPHP
jgi:F-box and WD-40 domain protein 1/11